MKCAIHPDIDTGLTCNICGKPICPRCMVQTPVGNRCTTCAKPTKLPTFQISARDIFIAILVGLGTALVCGIIWQLVRLFVLNFVFFNIVLALATGFVIGKVIGFSVNLKRGLPLKVIAAVSVFIAYVIGTHIGILPFYIYLSFGFMDIIAVGIGIYLAISRL